MKEAVIYLLAVTIAELVTLLVQPLWGMLCHILILVTTILHAALGLTDRHALQQLVLSLSLVPLVRILSLSMPLANIPRVWWYPIIYLPLIVATVVVIRILDYKSEDIGLNFGRLPVQLTIALTGFVFGVTEYLIQSEEIMSTGYELQQTWLLSVLLLPLSTGLTEELIFRGVLQRTAAAVFGSWRGIVYVSLLFAILHLGSLSWINIVFVFAVAIFFGWIVKRTGSLFGVTLAHSLTNLLLYIIIPPLM